MDSKIHPRVATKPLLAGQDSYSQNFKTFWKNLTLPFLQKYHVACAQTLCKNMVKDTVKVANSYAILTMLMRKQWIHRNKRDATAPKKNIQDNALFWVTHASNFAGCRFLDLSLYTRQLPRLREGEDIEFNLAMALKPFSAMARQCSWPNRPRHFQ